MDLDVCDADLRQATDAASSPDPTSKAMLGATRGRCLKSVENSEAMRIVQALANGINPITGEISPDAGPYNDPAVIRALSEVLRVLEKLGQPEKRTFPEHAGKPWTPEDKSLLASFDRGTPVKQLGAEHGWTGGATTSRLVKLGRLSDRSEILRAKPNQA
jgi:hypothetical protein